MDFATRDAYRHAIEELARGSGRSELEVAREAMAQRAAARTRAEATTGGDDPGYYLIGNGRRGLRDGARLPGSAAAPAASRRTSAAATPGYLGTIVVLSGVMLALPLAGGRAAGVGAAWLCVVLALLALVPASDLAIALVNRSVAALVTPDACCPGSSCATACRRICGRMVVVPTLLTDGADVEEQIERLEVHYLANPGRRPSLRAALRLDRCAHASSMPGDDATLAAAREGIARLNRRHGPAPDGGERFLLFHRRRLWNESERRVDGMGAQARASSTS